MEKVLDFWFVPNASASDTYKIWYKKDNDFDQLIRETFVHDWYNAVHGKYDDWMDSPKGCIALVVILDQFSRNMFRANSGSFSSDKKALAVTIHAIEMGFDVDMTPLEQQLIYMPLMHSEDLYIHDTYSLPKFKSSSYAVAHAEIIRRFGRYPHRNEILGRESTPEEIEFLKQPNSSF